MYFPLLRFYGAKSLKVAMSYHLVARAFSCKGDFRTALQHEKEAFGIYKQLVNIHFLFPVKCLSDPSRIHEAFEHCLMNDNCFSLRHDKNQESCSHLFLAWRRTRENERKFRMFETSHATSC